MQNKIHYHNFMVIKAFYLLQEGGKTEQDYINNIMNRPDRFNALYRQALGLYDVNAKPPPASLRLLDMLENKFYGNRVEQYDLNKVKLSGQAMKLAQTMIDKEGK